MLKNEACKMCGSEKVSILIVIKPKKLFFKKRIICKDCHCAGPARPTLAWARLAWNRQQRKGAKK